MSAHAKFSPSSAHRWIRCPGSIEMESGYENTTSSFAAEGTAAHMLASDMLEDIDEGFSDYIGRIYIADGIEFLVDQVMFDHVNSYVTEIREAREAFRLRGAASIELLIEKRVDFSDYIGIPEQTGTADAIIIAKWHSGDCHISVHDLKYGIGVEVSAEYNEQLMLYALGVLSREGVEASGVSAITLNIHQPRRQNMSSWDCPPSVLFGFATEAKRAAYIATQKTAVASLAFAPGEKQCRFCKAKNDCKALRQYTAQAVFDDFDVLDTKEETAAVTPDAGEALGIALSKVATVELWCKAVRDKSLEELRQGRSVPGYKLVAGRGGNRVWSNEEIAAKILEGMGVRVQDMYISKLISPPNAEKLVAKNSPEQWDVLKKHITKAEGGFVVAPETDKRPAVAIASALTDFETLPSTNIDDLI